MCESVEIILKRVGSFEMANAFDIAASLRGGFRNELTCVVGFCGSAFPRYIRPYAEGWYFLSKKGGEAEGHTVVLVC